VFLLHNTWKTGVSFSGVAFNVIGVILKLVVMPTYFIKKLKTMFALLSRNIFLYVSFFSPLRGCIDPRGCLKHMDEGWIDFWRLLKINYWLVRSLIRHRIWILMNLHWLYVLGLIGLCDCFLCNDKASHRQGFLLAVDYWLIIGKYYFYMQHLYDGCCNFPFLWFHL